MFQSPPLAANSSSLKTDKETPLKALQEREFFFATFEAGMCMKTKEAWKSGNARHPILVEQAFVVIGELCGESRAIAVCLLLKMTASSGHSSGDEQSLHPQRKG
jgi:hypothetical protein